MKIKFTKPVAVLKSGGNVNLRVAQGSGVMKKTLNKFLLLAGTIILATGNPAAAVEWLTAKEIRALTTPVGKFRDKGKGWCQYYAKDGSFTFKNLKSGETRIGKYWIDDQDRACIKGPKMSSPSCTKGYFYNDGKMLFLTDASGTYRLNVQKLLASHNACKF